MIKLGKKHVLLVEKGVGRRRSLTIPVRSAERTDRLTSRTIVPVDEQTCRAPTMECPVEDWSDAHDTIL